MLSFKRAGRGLNLGNVKIEFNVFSDQEECQLLDAFYRIKNTDFGFSEAENTYFNPTMSLKHTYVSGINLEYHYYNSTLFYLSAFQNC